MFKKLRVLIALALAGVIAAALPSCSTHVHDVSKWVVQTEATCSSQGVEVGICATCGETVYRAIDIDEDNHVYGDWQITKMPTETATGTATKKCTLNSDVSHQTVVSLPVLGSSEYVTTVTTRPTATKAGVRTYTLANDLGDITFTTEISNTGITSVRDAVEVACGEEGHDLVRSGRGTVALVAYMNAGNTASSSSSYAYSYEYGTDYTHIDNVKADSFERWYGVDEDGEIYGYASYNGGTPYEETKTTSGAENYYYGYRYLFTYSTFTGTFYGTENFILGLYNSAKLNANGDFSESIALSGSENLYRFSYGEYTVGASASYFSIVSVEFTLSSEYTIKTCTASCTTYVSTDDSECWKINDDGYAEVTAYQGIRYVNTYTLTQTTKTEDTTEPVNPYSAENMRITDFDVIYNDSIDENGDYVSASDILVEDDTVIPITANAATRATYTSGETDEDGNLIESYANAFRIENVTPSTMANSVGSDMTFYYRSYNNTSHTSYTDYEITYGTGGYSSVGIACRFDSDTNTFFVTCNIAGDVDIVLKTSKTEKVIHLDVTPIAPSTLYPMIYEYGINDYTWTSTYKNAVSETVYVNQPLYFSSEVPTTEAKYADASYTATVTSAVDSGGNAISSEYYTLVLDDTFHSQSMSSFTATKAGTYQITMVSDRNDEVYSVITVTVEDVPDVSELFSGTYSTSLSYTPKGTVKVTFEAGEEAGVYYATITCNSGAPEVLKCYYDGISLITEHYSGAEDTGFSLELNEAFDLVITHSTGIVADDGSDLLETKILTKLTT